MRGGTFISTNFFSSHNYLYLYSSAERKYFCHLCWLASVFLRHRVCQGAIQQAALCCQEARPHLQLAGGTRSAPAERVTFAFPPRQRPNGGAIAKVRARSTGTCHWCTSKSRPAGFDWTGRRAAAGGGGDGGAVRVCVCIEEVGGGWWG